MVKDLDSGDIYEDNHKKGSNCIGCDSYNNDYNCKYCSWSSIILE